MLISSCGGKRNSESETTDEMTYANYTSRDSSDINQLIKTYMGLIIEKKFDQAADMLYETDLDDPNGEVWAVPDYKREKLIDMYKALPIVKYQIVRPDFKKYNDNEVQCKVFINDELSTTWSFRPVKFIDDWYLTLCDTSGDDMLSK